MSIDTTIGLSSYTHAETGFPLILRPVAECLRTEKDVLDWYHSSKLSLEELTTQFGAVLLRGFNIPNTNSFGNLISCHTEHRLRYVGGASERARVQGNVYESTRINEAFKIGLHQEKSYMRDYPRLIAFYCEKPSESGGETLLCDMVKLTRNLSSSVKEAFTNRKIKYLRNFRDRNRPDPLIEKGPLREYHRTWQDAFDCDSPTVATEQCIAAGLELQWLDDGSATVSNTCPALIRHPKTNDEIWFNQVTSQHPNERSLGAAYGQLLKFYNKRPAFPYAVRYGDSSRIPLEDLVPVYDVFNSLEVAVSWQAGDYLLLDNVLAAHGRNPFLGTRVVRVALID